jgi:hypothetical protein
MACTPMPSHFFWEMGRRATWCRSSGGGATVLGVPGSAPLMAASGPEGSWIPSSHIRMRARSGRHAWWKVGQGLDLLSASS